MTIELTEPTGHFLYLLAQPSLSAVPKHIIEQHGQSWTQPENLVTNGVFQLQSVSPNFKNLTLTLNPLYYGRVSGNIQTIEVFGGPIGQTPLNIYEKHQLDIFDVSMVTNFDPKETQQQYSEFVVISDNNFAPTRGH